jgi:transcription antitermination factor NusG
MRGRRWYAVAFKHRQHYAALAAITALGFGTFLPMVPVPMPKGGVNLRPLCAPYLFCEFDVARDAWGQLNRLAPLPKDPILRGVGSALPAMVSERMLDALRRAIANAADKVNAVHDPVAALVAVGASVRLLRCAASGRNGQVSAVRRRHGVVEAQVKLDGCVLPLWVPSHQLQLLGA